MKRLLCSGSASTLLVRVPRLPVQLRLTGLPGVAVLPGFAGLRSFAVLVSFAVLLNFVVVVSFPVLLSAQDTRGRLPDGRAYRTDAEGNEIVDYIAELEVLNEALNRRIQGLEGELEQKRAALERVTGGADAELPLRERSLTGSIPVDLPAATGETTGISREVERPRGELAAARDTHGRELAALREACVPGEAARLRNDLEAARYDLKIEQDLRLKERTATAERSCPVISCDVQNAELGRVRAEARAAEAELLRVRGALADVEGRSTRLEGELTGAAAAQRQELEQARRDIADLRVALDRRTAELAEVRAKSVTAPALPPPASFGSSPGALAAVSRGSGESRDRARQAAVDSLRAPVSADLNRLRGLVATRDGLFARSGGRIGSEVQFKPSALISARGMGLDAVAAEIRSAETVSQLAALRRDLGEIRRVVEDDIALLKRTAR